MYEDGMAGNKRVEKSVKSKALLPNAFNLYRVFL